MSSCIGGGILRSLEGMVWEIWFVFREQAQSATCARCSDLVRFGFGGSFGETPSPIDPLSHVRRLWVSHRAAAWCPVA
jgi:hypothetical protein